MNAPETDREREWLRTFEPLRQVLDQPDQKGWLESSTLFGVSRGLDRRILRKTAHHWYDDSCWAKQTHEAKFHAIMPDGTLLESFVKDGERLRRALRRLPVRPRRVIHIAYGGGPTGPAEEGFSETTVVNSYVLDAGRLSFRSILAKIRSFSRFGRLCH